MGKIHYVVLARRKKLTITGDPKMDRRVIEPKHLLKLGEVEACALVWSLEGKELSGGRESEGGLTKKHKRDMEGILN